MRIRLAGAGLLACALACSSSTDEELAQGTGPAPVPRGSVYDEARLPAAKAEANNLLRAGDFEGPIDDWALCGNVTSVTDSTTPAAGQVLAFSGMPELCGEAGGILDTRRFNGTATQRLDYDRNVEHLTISLRVRVEGPLESSISLAVVLSDTFDRDSSFFDTSVGFVPQSTRDWIPMRWVIGRNDLDDLVDESLVVLSIQARDLPNATTIFVDDVRVVEGITRTQPQPLPNELRDVFSAAPLVFINNDAQAVAVLSGTSLTYVDYPAISTEVILRCASIYHGRRGGGARQVLRPRDPRKTRRSSRPAALDSIATRLPEARNRAHLDYPRCARRIRVLRLSRQRCRLGLRDPNHRLESYAKLGRAHVVRAQPLLRAESQLRRSV